MNDYISREAVVRYLKGYSEKECNSNSPYGMITSSVLNKAERAISEMPAADVQPVRRGKWTGDEVIQCSICNFTLNGNAFERIVRKYFKYCPNCGARMKQEE